jgi:hypothetical protein
MANYAINNYSSTSYKTGTAVYNAIKTDEDRIATLYDTEITKYLEVLGDNYTSLTGNKTNEL